ncbi:hypothetical protein LBMAG53_39160 [Planctomycetota bacterium]|nr:hypothetical protein LBMAG53_39160 [Planctomycetota bacterium]
MKPPPLIRCAIYTRKSTEEGLDKDFNTLDAQRESAEACIASQRSQGWKLVPTRYDDGGFSGGTTERPALKRLLADIEAGLIDCVVVYKVDRLSRSLLDFVQMLQVFERRQVAFVSVTQQFNTTTSMGRLTLNILLSFAQFEREIITERIRDKCAASRRKGKWTGGRPMLGYDVAPEGRRLLVNPREAEQVRRIFAAYLELRSLNALVRHAKDHGWRNKTWTNRKGAVCGGLPLTRSQLGDLLNNPLYIGQVVYKDERHPGEQPAIIDAALFAQVQQELQHQDRTGGAEHRVKHPALLRGLLRCAPCGCGMTHSYRAPRGTGRAYRHYLCQRKNTGHSDACPTPWLPAAEIERVVVDEIKAIGSDPLLAAEVLAEVRKGSAAELEAATQVLTSAKATFADLDRRLRMEVTGGATIDAARLADLNDRLRQAEQDAAKAKVRVAAAKAALPDEHQARTALQRFTPVFDGLSPGDQAALLQSLLVSVSFDATAGRMALAFRPTGIAALMPRDGGASTPPTGP